MELSNSLLLDEAALAALPEHKRPDFVYEWLSFLSKVLTAAQKNDIQQCYKQLVAQLTAQLTGQLSSASRQLLGSCMAQLFACSDTSLLFDTVGRCGELVRARDDSPPSIVSKLTAVTCLGCMYGRLGRMMGRSYEEIVQLLLKCLRGGECALRCEVLYTLAQLCAGMGSAAASLHKQVYRACRASLTDRAMLVRCAAAECLLQLSGHWPLLYGSELDSVVSLCLRALDGSTVDCRRAISRLLGTLVARTQTAHGTATPAAAAAAAAATASTHHQHQSHHATQQQQQLSAGGTVSTAAAMTAAAAGKGRTRVRSLDDALSLLMNGFVKSGAGFLKGTGGMIKGSASVSREQRVGIALSYVVFAERMGRPWLERHMGHFISHVLKLASHSRAGSTHADTVYVRHCVVYILGTTLGRMLSEGCQLTACKELVAFITQKSTADMSVDANVLESGGAPAASAPPLPPTSAATDANRHHAVTCALMVLASLCTRLDTGCVALITDNTVSLLDCVCEQLSASAAAVRYSAAWCLRCVCIAVPVQLTSIIDRCLDRLAGESGSCALVAPLVPSAAGAVPLTSEAVSGYSCALAALLGAVTQSPLGIPSCRSRQLATAGEQLLRSAAHSAPHLSQARTQAGWLLLAAVASLGGSAVKSLLPRLLLLWRNTFPRSAKELESEKRRGDAFTWQVCLESRAGALACMHSVLLHFGSATPSGEFIRHLLVPLEAAVNMFSSLGFLVKSYGQQLKASLAMVRLRLYEVLTLIPQHALINIHSALLRLLVAEFTSASDSGGGGMGAFASSAVAGPLSGAGGGGGGGGSWCGTCTSLLASACQAEESVVLVARLVEPQLALLEQQMNTNGAVGSGALEHDITCLFSRKHQCAGVPGALPLGVAVIDGAILVFGQLFPHIANKQRVHMISHFSDCIRQAKGHRLEVVQSNVFAALLCGLRAVVDAKSAVGDVSVITAAKQLILSCLSSSWPLLRRAAAECLGVLGQAVNDPRFIADMAEYCYDTLQSARDLASRTGHSMALGCMYRQGGSIMSRSQQLTSSVSILLALTQDMTSPTVQLWSLHALCMMADAGGPMFRAYVEPLLTLCLRLLLAPSSALAAAAVVDGSSPSSSSSSYSASSCSASSSSSVVFSQLPRCVAQCLSALIVTVGPELQGNGSSISSTRSSLLCACSVLLASQDAHVRAEATSCLQQLQLFAPRQLSLSLLVPQLCRSLCDDSVVVRRAAVSCLRQVTQREARLVCAHAAAFAAEANWPPWGSENSSSRGGVSGSTSGSGSSRGGSSNDLVLVEVLLQLVAGEREPVLLQQLHDTLHALVSCQLVTEQLGGWLQLCAGVLTTSGNAGPVDTWVGDQDETCFDDDMEHFTAVSSSSSASSAAHSTSTPDAIAPRWPARVFVAELLQKIFAACQSNPIHFDLARAKSAVAANPSSDWLVLHLAEVMQMAFLTATSDVDQLRLAGLSCLQQLIQLFRHTADPEFPQRLLLEQYQAQVSSALRPAFAADAACHVTARACHVCSAWICSGVTRAAGDLHRFSQLLVFSASRLRATQPPLVYNESALTLERLAVLKAWAEVYITAMKNENSLDRTTTSSSSTSSSSSAAGGSGNVLLQLVLPELPALSKYWLAALKDHALLSLPAELEGRVSGGGGGGGFFYTSDTVETVRPYYQLAWPSVLMASAVWLSSCGFDCVLDEKLAVEGGDNLAIGPSSCSSRHSALEISTNRFHLLFGVCMEALCNTRHCHSPATLQLCLNSLRQLLNSSWSRDQLQQQQQLLLELLATLQRLMLVHGDSSDLCRSVLQLALSVGQLQLCHLDHRRQSRRAEQELSTTNGCTPASITDGREGEVVYALQLVGEGESDGGQLLAGQSPALQLVQLAHDCCRRSCGFPSAPAATDATTNNSNSSSGNHNSYWGPDKTDWCLDSEHVNWHLLSLCLSLFTTALKLCSPPAALSLLPPVLYLSTGVLRCVAKVGKCSWPFGRGGVSGDCEEGGVGRGGVSGDCEGGGVGRVTRIDTLAVLLSTLRSICRMDSWSLSHSAWSRDWCRCLQSAWSTVLQMFESDGEAPLARQPLLSALCCFVLVSPSGVGDEHNKNSGGSEDNIGDGETERAMAQLQAASLHRLAEAVNCDKIEMRLHAVTLCRSLFAGLPSTGDTENYCLQLSPQLAAYIVRLAPLLLRCLHSTAAASAPANQLHVQLVEQQLLCIRQLLSSCRRDMLSQMLSLYLCVLARFLLVDQQALVSVATDPSAPHHPHHHQLRTSLHHICIGQLNSVAPQYPQIFKSLLSESTSLRQRIETALIVTRQAEVQRSNSAAATARAPPLFTAAHTSIKLTTDFSGFA